MTTDPPSGPRPAGPRLAPSSSDDAGFELLLELGEQLGHTIERKKHSGRKLKNVVFEYETDARGVHDMAGEAGYSLASNWFVQRLAELAIANSVSKSEMCVFLFVAGGQLRGTGVAPYTQQEITNGLNRTAVKTGARCITRSTVNRAIKALCEYGWLEKSRNGSIQLNIRLWFNGNSTAQHQVLDDLNRRHDGDPEAFPYHVGPEVDSAQLLLPEADEQIPPVVEQKQTG